MQNKYDFNTFKKKNKLHHAETHCVEMQGKNGKQLTHGHSFQLPKQTAKSPRLHRNDADKAERDLKFKGFKV